MLSRVVRAGYFLISFGILCSPLPGNTTPISAFDVKALTDASDLVIEGRTAQGRVIGDIQVRTGAGVISAANVETLVDVEAVLKGHGIPSTILVRFPRFLPGGGSIGLDGIPNDQDRILFLKASDNTAEYIVTDPYHPSLPGITSPSPLPTDPLAAVSEVECAVIVDSGPGRQRDYGLFGLSEGWTSRALSHLYDPQERRKRRKL